MQNLVDHTDHITTNTTTQNHFLVVPILSQHQKGLKNHKEVCSLEHNNYT